MQRKTFTKDERLISKSAIDSLFEVNNHELYTYPLKVRFRITKMDSNTQRGILPKIGVIVPKRKFKNAVDRNTLKRRMRECYRLNNAALKSATIDNACSLEMMIMYISASKEKYPTINKAFLKLLPQLISKIENVQSTN